MINRTIALALAGLFGAALYAADKPVTVSLKDADGKDVGTAKISEKGTGVKIALNLKNLPPGEHEVTVETGTPVRRGKPFRFEGFPMDDRPWDDSTSLRREDMYGDDGR